MADSAVAVTAGSGTNIDTRTEGTNGNHRQVVVIGDPATNAGVAPVDATNGLAVDVKASALPSGAATSAKQDTIIGHLDGVEGVLATIDTDTGNISTKIDTVAGAVAGTEMQVDVVGALPAGNNVVGQFKLTDGTEVASVDTSNRLEVAVGNTVTVGSHAVTNAGTFATQVDGSALTALQKIDDPVLVDDAGFTPATSSVMMAGFQADESSTDSVDEGDAGAVRMTLDRKLIVTEQPHTAGGLSIFRSLDLDETEEDIKTSAGQIYGMWVTNTATSTRFVKFYNATAANTTVGSTTPVITIGIPGNTSDDVSGLFSTSNGIAFGTAICAAATTGVADADTGAPGANEVIINVFYK